MLEYVKVGQKARESADGRRLMPRFVDHARRRDEILDAAAWVLAELGYGKFSLRAVGERMGGSTTLVTHYFSSREQLMIALTDRVFDEAEAEVIEIQTIIDPHERLRSALAFFLPVDDESAMQERIRIALLPYRRSDATVEEFFARLEVSMRALLRAGLIGFVPDAELDANVALLRVWVNGIALSVVEHPELWTPAQQNDALGRFTALLELPS
ncbi:TetR/AcrR family transcriptional regulator [Microbacterium sp. NPDC089698]|uniref:TetR/AcrR family transcriptional regulator n=1 Tax=Microbacterium sp. NPDC089698 TaxID=3364200 RepID=UPI0037FD710E